ncbi:MAG TPA: 2Fe-2S iron-sulfur cluster-binding protein, partial [Steroidobacteraceae bacterium]|nr:2Fe-2S iron-sulfur cluster-binding protein [Steroidobacteraceae bacterium]
MTFRTPEGGRIDRNELLPFSFDGRSYQGYRGDTLASALLANGVHLVGRSFKYHRPRGIFSAGAEEPNALVTVTRDAARITPNLRATQVELYRNLNAHSQNRWPSLEFDLGRVNDVLSPFFPAGFYYKTFMWPRGAWKSVYEPLIRRAAGLGKAPTLPDPDRYAQRYAHCDVLVVGSGPAGLAAALTAANAGARVILCEEQCEFGGSLLSDPAIAIAGKNSAEWLKGAVARLGENTQVALLPRTTAFGYFPHNLIGLSERLTDHLDVAPDHLPRERLWQVRARHVLLATGALERPLIFPGNDKPGVMLAGAAHTYLHRFGVRVGSRAVVVTCDDDAYQTALDLKAAGVEIAAIADVRSSIEGPLAAAARDAGIPISAQATVLRTGGDSHINAVTLGVMRNGSPGERRHIDCDALLMSGGYTPSVHLFSQSRGKLDWSDALKAFVPGRSAEAERSAGACRGIYGLAQVLADGARAAAQVLELDAPLNALEVNAVERRHDAYLGALPGDASGQGGSSRQKSFVDFQHDVTTRDLELATREGFHSIEHVKRYTTTGMATDQGKTSNLNAMAIVAEKLNKPIPQVGLTTFRMPYTPVSFAG